MEDPRWLTDAEYRAWIGYRRMRARLDLQLARDLARDSGLSEPDYDVLSTVSEAEQHQMRLSELAARMLWSRSRLSHHITRMEQRGLVAREECADDARGTVVVLTRAGWRAIEAAAQGHVASVRRHFIDLLTSDQVDALAAITQAVLDHLASPGQDQLGLP
ncbi:MAG TPA: MarR family transcriptional regulator [Streptosporangiaceae bacterium]|nr:MarR family transcriptional regulator [Streptosporangiaceae bacterium]